MFVLATTVQDDNTPQWHIFYRDSHTMMGPKHHHLDIIEQSNLHACMNDAQN